MHITRKSQEHDNLLDSYYKIYYIQVYSEKFPFTSIHA